MIQQSRGRQTGSPVMSLAFVAMLAPLIVLGCGLLSVAAETQPITVAVTPDAAGLDAYTAQQKGYFKGAGLDVTIKFITDISLLPPVINAGQYQIGNIVPTIILRAAAQGIPLTAICGDHVSTREKPSFTIVTLASSDIKSLTDLKGHIVGSPAVGGGFSISMLYYLKTHGIDPQSVKQIQSTGASLPGLLDNHRVDAILSQSPYNLKVQGSAYRDLGSPMIAMSDRLQTTLYVAKQSWAADNRQTVVAFCSALSKADDFINSHPDDAKSLLAQLAGLSPEDAKAFRLDTYDATMARDTMKVWLDAMNSLNLLPKAVDPTPLMFH